MLIYVDGIILLGNDETQVQLIKDSLQSFFKTKDLGMLTYFLGIEATQSPQGIFISQKKYAHDILHEFVLLACKPYKIPLSSKPFDNDNDPSLEDQSKYRSVIYNYMS